MLDCRRLDGAATQDLIIVGAGGLAAEGLWVAEAVNQFLMAAGRPALWNILGCCVYDPSLYAAEILSYRVLGTPWDVSRSRAGDLLHYTCCIGDNRIREQEVGVAESFGWRPVTLIHPSCQIAPNAVIGPGTYVAAGAVVCTNTKVGSHVVINNHVSVGHDSIMGDFSQACPGSRISGKCKVGRSAFLGTNSTLLPGVALGDRSVLGANSVALDSVEPDVTAVGIPARIVPRRKD
jgi:sugar O-acyltransferase (sialic acid O-acetyltransferase NeuD family)